MRLLTLAALVAVAGCAAAPQTQLQAEREKAQRAVFNQCLNRYPPGYMVQEVIQGCRAEARRIVNPQFPTQSSSGR